MRAYWIMVRHVMGEFIYGEIEMSFTEMTHV